MPVRIVHTPRQFERHSRKEQERGKILQAASILESCLRKYWSQ